MTDSYDHGAQGCNSNKCHMHLGYRRFGS